MQIERCVCGGMQEEIRTFVFRLLRCARQRAASDGEGDQYWAEEGRRGHRGARGHAQCGDLPIGPEALNHIRHDDPADGDDITRDHAGLISR